MAKALGHKGLSKNVHKTAIKRHFGRQKEGAFIKKRCQENLSIVRYIHTIKLSSIQKR